MEDEIKLLKYFLPSAKTKIWNELTDDGKLKFIDRFWEVNNTSPSSRKNDYFELIKERIKYCNEKFSHARRIPCFRDTYWHFLMV